MNNNETTSTLLVKLTIYQLISFNIIALIGVALVLILLDIELFWLIHIIVALGTLIINPIILKKNISKSLKKDKEEIKSKAMLAPLIVAIIVGSYALSLGSEFTSGNYMVTPTTTDLANLFASLRVQWIIMCMVYLTVSEVVACKLNKKLDGWLKEE